METASRIGPSRGVIENPTKLFQEEWEVGGHPGVASHCGYCPIQGLVRQGGHNEGDPGTVRPVPGVLVAKQELTLPEEPPAAVELPGERLGRRQ